MIMLKMTVNHHYHQPQQQQQQQQHTITNAGVEDSARHVSDEMEYCLSDTVTAARKNRHTRVFIALTVTWLLCLAPHSPRILITRA